MRAGPAAAGDCCAYRARLRLEKNKKNRRPKKKILTDACGKPLCGSGPAKAKKCHKLKKKSKKIKKPEKEIPCISKILDCMKPSYFDRAKYLDVRHILCVLEDSEVLRLINTRDLRERIRKFNNLCDSEKGSQDGNFGALAEEYGLCGKVKKPKKHRKKGCNLERKKNDHNKIRCGQKKYKDDDCTSICSLDSRIDLTEFVLTEKEIKEIERHAKRKKAWDCEYKEGCEDEDEDEDEDECDEDEDEDGEEAENEE